MTQVRASLRLVGVSATVLLALTATACSVSNSGGSTPAPADPPVSTQPTAAQNFCAVLGASQPLHELSTNVSRLVSQTDPDTARTGLESAATDLDQAGRIAPDKATNTLLSRTATDVRALASTPTPTTENVNAVASDLTSLGTKVQGRCDLPVS